MIDWLPDMLRKTADNAEESGVIEACLEVIQEAPIQVASEIVRLAPDVISGSARDREGKMEECTPWSFFDCVTVRIFHCDSC